MKALHAFLVIFLLPLLLHAQEDRLPIAPELSITDNATHGAPTWGVTTYSNAEYAPLLPMLFFDEPGDAHIAARYRRFESAAAARSYHEGDTVRYHEDEWRSFGDIRESSIYRKYREILDILGVRMTRYPAATIMLHGGYSAEPGESQAVATKRAEAVRGYLRDIWHIEPSRIAIAAPERLSDSLDHDTQHDEARRVRIATESRELFRPVRFTHTFRQVWTSNEHRPRLHLTLRVTPHADPERVVSITFVQFEDDREVGRLTVVGDYESTTYTIPVIWNLGGLRPEEGTTTISIVAEVEIDGEAVRRSNVVTVPGIMKESGLDDDDADESYRWFLVPFFDRGDTRLREDQRRLIEEEIGDVALIPRLNLHLAGIRNFMETYTEAEKPMSSEEWWRMNPEARIVRMRDHETDDRDDEGWLMTPEIGPSSVRFIGDPELHYWVDTGFCRECSEAEIRKLITEARQRNAERGAIADTIAYQRARAVHDFLLHTLAVPLASDSAEPAVSLEIDYDIFSSSSFSSPLLPEEQWYRRCVVVDLIDSAKRRRAMEEARTRWERERADDEKAWEQWEKSGEFELEEE